MYFQLLSVGLIMPSVNKALSSVELRFQLLYLNGKLPLIIYSYSLVSIRNHLISVTLFVMHCGSI